MAQAEDGIEDDASQASPRSGFARWRVRVSLGLLALLLVVFGYGWTQREQIADNYIIAELEALGLDASYDIESIGATRQVLANLVIGDPERPDFTADRVVVLINYSRGIPSIGRLELEAPRIFGTLHSGEVSFGSLDPVIFAETDVPPALPDLDLLVSDGRGLFDTDYGPVGLFLEGEGELDSGFAGQLAVSAPRLASDQCRARSVSIYGGVTTLDGRPKFTGPLRLKSLNCSAGDAAITSAIIETEITGDANLAGLEASAAISTGEVQLPGLAASTTSGTVAGFYREGRLSSDVAVNLRDAANGGLTTTQLTAEGSLRASEGFGRIETRLNLAGKDVRLGNSVMQSLAGLESRAGETLLEPLIGKLRKALTARTQGSRFTAQLTARRSEAGASLVVPEARLIGREGGVLLSVSRLQIGSDGEGVPLAQGNFIGGGEGLPSFSGRMEQGRDGAPVFRMQIGEYSAQGASLELPEMVIAQARGGQLGFAGSLVASGPLPGGMAQNLRIPIDGLYSDRSGLLMWRRCTEIEFERLELASLALEGKGLTLCPSSAGAILRSNDGSLKIAAGAPALDLAGKIGETSIEIRSGPIGFAFPGVLSARALDIVLGPDETASRFKVSNIDAELGGQIAGTFSDADIRLFEVPMNLLSAEGRWSYADQEFMISDGQFRLVDREEEERFHPLIARDAVLSLAENRISAMAALREPNSDRIVTEVQIAHDLGTAIGHADITVAGLRFDEGLQPDEVTPLVLGVIANADGVVTGSGRIDWQDEDITSSGAFATQDFDLAAEFGPVEGVSGQIQFTDLINLTTAPDQRLTLASMNPGIEIFDGEISYEIRDGTLLAVNSGDWPFLGGTLELRPVTLNIGASEERRYVLNVSGVEASQFIQRMELSNLAATGLFDGQLPLIFDEMGNGRIEDGILTARPPGGNLSYVGELTYEDLSPIANFAFDTLRSLDYREMELRMKGSLTGEIVTQIRFDGVKQGEGANSNILTRQIARLPIRFNVNISAPFYQLITSLQAMYDPAFVRDPRELGLLTDDGTRFQRDVRETGRNSDTADEPLIQSPESENQP